MSQNFAVLEPVSQATYSASFDLDIQIPLSASLIYRDTGYCQKHMGHMIWSLTLMIVENRAFLTMIKSYI